MGMLEEEYATSARPPAGEPRPRPRPANLASPGASPFQHSGNGNGNNNTPKPKPVGGAGISQTTRPRLVGTNKPGVKSFGYGYYDQNGQWIYPREDMQDGYGPGGSGAKFGGTFGGVSNILGATGYGSGAPATGVAKFVQDGGITGAIGKGIKNLLKPATYEVQKNDNLAKIATANNMTLEQLLAKNPGLDPKAAIKPGQQIKIGGLFGGTQTPEQAAATAAMMAQMNNGNNTGGGVGAVKCPPGQVFNPVTNSCEPAPTTMTAAAQTSMPASGYPVLITQRINKLSTMWHRRLEILTPLLLRQMGASCRWSKPKVVTRNSYL
jgi:hypothetical protein